MANRLINEVSPYLLQHANNPVDWFPWGQEAFGKARSEDKPVFLSIGYATCHWCHVMERESFEDQQAAAALNDAFVCIKVDREERPDIDAAFMAVSHLISGSGGWPLNIIMTPDKKPFFSATYIPRNSGFGRLGVIDLCGRATRAWRSDRQNILAAADSVAAHLAVAFEFQADAQERPDSSPDRAAGLPDAAWLEQAAERIAKDFDERFGGFGQAPKFPMPHRLIFLLRASRRSGNTTLRDMVDQTLTAMRLGGLWDHVGFGFHRYATDQLWLLPHFEKMLYDQALLTLAYLENFDLTGNPLHSRTAREILTYVRREMTGPGGGFYAAQDADSEGVEGKYYLWSQSEFENIIVRSDQDIPWSRILNVRAEGNFEEEATRRPTGTNILHMTDALGSWAERLQLPTALLEKRWEEVRGRLFEERSKRVHPLTDDKIMTDWNGLMITAMARAAEVLQEREYAEAAAAAAEFVRSRLVGARGGLLHRFRRGQAAIAATANDYAYFISGLIGLRRATSEGTWLDWAVELQEQMEARFGDPGGGYYLTDADQDDLPVRPRELYDGAIPSYNSVALHNLLLLGRMTADRRWQRRARRLIDASAAAVRQQPSACTNMLNAFDLALEERF